MPIIDPSVSYRIAPGADPSQARSIAQHYLEAFAIPAQFDDDQPDQWKALVEDPNGPPAEIEFDNRAGLVYHLHLGRISDNLVRYVALVELTAAWQRAGLIDARRDEHQWQRNPDGMTDPTQRDQVNAAIEVLNLPPPGQGNTGPTPTHHPDPKAASVALALLQDLDHNAAVLLFGSRGRGDHHPESDIDLLVLNLTDNLNPDDPPDADDQLYELARTKAKERYQRPPAIDLQLLEGWSHPLDNWYFADKVWPDHRHFLAPTPPHGLAFANTPEALASHPLSLASNAPDPNGGLPFYFLSRAASTITDGGTGFGALEYLDQPMPKPRT